MKQVTIENRKREKMDDIMEYFTHNSRLDAL